MASEAQIVASRSEYEPLLVTKARLAEAAEAATRDIPESERVGRAMPAPIARKMNAPYKKARSSKKQGVNCMELEKAILTRRSVRKFKDTPVPMENATPLIPAEHMFLTAVEHGVSACFIGWLDVAKRAKF